ncbi:location of vulva defective 1 isoform X1 [Drosophila elegans]|uniref:location of vulva defective 1 isoform X1 n=1 Tax=Drosophila elegans TaxID=30023 RepID=UPI0007E6F38F|nr:location of vulva defective 1 isoform X1 [Drosophila elegans]XP_041563065.1 location of vulva defective 1 isoform X1 [Drosophila elegans]
MYKTIRHGENSLQYTILPQNDDFRIEGKLSGTGRSSGVGASSSGSSASSSGSSVKVKGQRRRRSFFAYLGLIFVCTVIIGAVLIPFLVSAECLPNPTEWFLKTKAALVHSPQRGGGERAETVPGSPTLPTGSPLLQQNVGRNVQIVNRNGIEQFVIRLNKTNTNASTTSGTTATETTSTSSSSTTTSTTTTTRAPTTTTTTTTSTTTTTREPPVTTPRYMPPATTITTRIIQVPLLKSAAKKPIMPPVLAKAQGPQIQTGAGQNSRMQVQSSDAEEQARESSDEKSNSAWIKTHWAFIDPSTLFQWTGYKDEDSVLLPALLGFALIGVILIITVCLVARNKRTIVSSVRKRNRNDIEDQGAEDNATLLTTTNMSDDD